MSQVVAAYIQLGRIDDAEANLDAARSVAPENESVLQATLRFLLVAGRHAELDTMTAQRAQIVINNSGLADSKMHLERLVWAAIGRLASGDSAGASEWREKAMLDSISLDPHPQSVRCLALLSRSRVLEEHDQASISAAMENGRAVAQRVQAQGWGTGDADYALATLAAAGGAVPEALGHLQDAVAKGWRSVSFANRDQAMAPLHSNADYLALIQQVEQM